MLLMFLAEGNKVFTLMLWIAAMFGVASYLIAVEYADYELQKKVEQITQMEQESLGALLARLTPAEKQRVRDFAAGLLAARNG